jgi:hypothetical protein
MCFLNKGSFLKTDLYLFGDAKNKSVQYRIIFSSQMGKMTMKYLGMSLNKIRLRNKDWDFVKK